MPWIFNPFTGNLDWSNSSSSSGTLPTGGTTGQALVKASSTNYDAVWTTLGTMAAQNASAVSVTGGSINGATIGATTAAAGSFTDLSASGYTDLGGYGSPVSYGGATYGVLSLAGDTSGPNGVQMYNSNTGSQADFRFSVFDTDRLHYLTFSVPGKNNNLTLFGQARSTITGIFSNSLYGGTDRSLVFGTVKSSPVYFGTNNTVRATILGTGEMGIGTTSPSTKLHVAGPIRVQTYTVATVPSASTSGAGSMIYVTNPASSARPYWSDGTNWRDAVGTLLA